MYANWSSFYVGYQSAAAGQRGRAPSGAPLRAAPGAPRTAAPGAPRTAAPVCNAHPAPKGKTPLNFLFLVLL